ncbi:hypothetical protein [Botrimarina hoheduenensis]|uniref:Uncharacterized protein n=1 Tax=Botrimarina hoheduenensis TaxID=2528000 RepID=A0A5C5VYY6_9BACT|nr:hypothetical protein [Botrimarina hoheduenensis]TWT43255.1 hypothetical protein Pla111_22050 [Botrimarina hoheduenensis]
MLSIRNRLLCCVAMGLGGLTIDAAEVPFWQDPVVTYTNGMRLPSTTSQRSHNVYWQCDPGHRGYCDCRLYGPCRNELRQLGSRVENGYRLPYGAAPGPVVNHELFAADDAVEPAEGQRLGVIPLDQANTPRLSVPTAAVPQTPAGSVWLDALQSLGNQSLENQTLGTPAVATPTP